VTLTSLEREQLKQKIAQNNFIDLNECHNWQMAKMKKTGYQVLWFRKKMMLVHRLSFAVFKGDFDDEWDVLHRYDNRGCVNSDHLFLGTHADNMADRDRKKRQGDQVPRCLVRVIAKLTCLGHLD
jgi:hypothetical protein